MASADGSAARLTVLRKIFEQADIVVNPGGYLVMPGECDCPGGVCNVLHDVIIGLTPEEFESVRELAR